MKHLHDDSSLAAYTKTEYFDPELGWFSEFAHYSYESVVENDEQEQPIITHNDIEDGFKTLEQIYAFIQLFMSPRKASAGMEINGIEEKERLGTNFRSKTLLPIVE